MSFLDHPLLEHLLTVVGVLLAFFAFARLLSERRQPSNTMAWMLSIVLIPYVGVPLYLILGGRKLRRLVARKSPVRPDIEGIDCTPSTASKLPTALAVNANGLSPLVNGNSVHLITSGEAAFAELSEHIRKAKHSIHITSFILARDDTGRRFVNLLAERARAGVKVRLLLDAVGSPFSSRGFCNPIRKAGGEVMRFMPVLPFIARRNSANLRNHRKIAVFDQQTAMVGGHNITRDYMGPSAYRKRWSDFGAVIDGPAAVLLNEIFLADWSFASGQPIGPLRKNGTPTRTRASGSSQVQVVASGPDVAGDSLYEGIVSMVQEAERSICIVTPYFIPDEVLFRSLMVKARAGCRIVLIVPAKSNHPITDLARRHYLRELKTAGVQVWFFGPGMMHSKAVVIDDRIGLLGSANFDLRSLFVNFEVGVFVYSPSDLKAMHLWTASLLEHCKPMPAQRRGNRMLGTLVEELSRLLAPLL